jgi:hypothetical protein
VQVINAHNESPPAERTPVDERDEFLAELSDFNRETMLLTQASAIITKTGKDLDNLLKAGIETLNPDEHVAYLHTLKQFEAFIEEYKTRIAAQIAREKALKRKDRRLKVAVDFHPLSSIGNN